MGDSLHLSLQPLLLQQQLRSCPSALLGVVLKPGVGVSRSDPLRLKATGMKQGRYRPALGHICPPTSIHDAVWENELIAFYLTSFPALPRATPAGVKPFSPTTHLPLTAAFMDASSSTADIIDDDCQTRWDGFFKNTGFYQPQPPSWSMFCRPCTTSFHLTV